MIDSFPLLLLFFPLLFALSAGIIPRRWSRLVTGAGVLLLFLLYVFLSSLPIDFANGALEWDLWNQSWRLTEGDWIIVRLLYGGTIILLLSAVFWPAARRTNFVAGSLAALAPLTAALMLPFTLGSAALLLAAVPVVMMLDPADAPGAGRAALRYFIFVTLAVPFFLLAGWMLFSEQLVFMNLVWRLLLPGVALLLAGFPFHVWVRPLVREASPLLVPFLFGLVHLVLLIFVLRIVQDNPLLENNEQFYLLLRWSGVGTATVGGILAWQRQGRAQLLGSLLLLDMGSAVAAASLGSEGIRPVLLLLQNRFIGLLLVLVGSALLERFVDKDAEWVVADTLFEAPWATILFCYGLLSLVGLPLTPGFGGRWALLSLIAAHSLWPATILLLALAAGAIALIVRVFALAPSSSAGARSSSSIPFVHKAVSFLLLLVASAIALFPYPFQSFATRLALLLTT